MGDEQVQYSEADGIAEISLCRPEKRNALTSAMFVQLRHCFDRFSSGDARVAILKSCDDTIFSAGADLTDPPEVFLESIPEFGVRCDKPIIAAVSGKAIGAGLILAMMCDFVVMSEGAELIYPEAKIGVDKGAATALVRRAPLRVVMELLMFGEPMSAQRAYETGMVNRLVPQGQHISEAQAMARQLANNAPLVVEMLKRMCLDAAGNTAIQTMYDASARVAHVMKSQDALNGLEAFGNKQKPTFSGK